MVCLSEFALASGKLPGATMSFVGGALTKQEPSIFTNCRCDHTLLNSCHCPQGAIAIAMSPGSVAPSLSAIDEVRALPVMRV